MTTTRKKLEGNGLWESSRMMLPEHKETIIRRQLEEGRKNKPVLFIFLYIKKALPLNKLL